MDIGHESKTNSEARNRDRIDGWDLRQETKTPSEAGIEGAEMKKLEMKSLAGIGGMGWFWR
jgi:hypothetical protein